MAAEQYRAPVSAGVEIDGHERTVPQSPSGVGADPLPTGERVAAAYDAICELSHIAWHLVGFEWGDPSRDVVGNTLVRRIHDLSGGVLAMLSDESETPSSMRAQLVLPGRKAAQ